MPDFDPILKLVSSLGIGIVLAIALWYALLVPRKDKDGKPRSSLLVPGWKHDADQAEYKAELDRVTTFYQLALHDEQDRCAQRVADFRTYRDEAVVRAKEAADDTRRLLEAVTSGNHSIDLLLEIQRMAARDGGKPEASRDG